MELFVYIFNTFCFCFSNFFKYLDCVYNESWNYRNSTFKRGVFVGKTFKFWTGPSKYRVFLAPTFPSSSTLWKHPRTSKFKGMWATQKRKWVRQLTVTWVMRPTNMMMLLYGTSAVHTSCGWWTVGHAAVMTPSERCWVTPRNLSPTSSLSTRLRTKEERLPYVLAWGRYRTRRSWGKRRT